MPGAGAPGIRLTFDGLLLIANFTPDSHGRGYLEAFMDWQLIYRDQSQLNSLAADLLQAENASHNLFLDCHDNVAYLQIIKS